jgi:ribosome-binding factor A
MPQGHRPDRVGDRIREEVTVLLQRTVHDPGIGFVTVTRVQVTPDLQLARVFYTTLGSDAERRETARALTRALPFLRRQVGERLNLRRVPVLQFVFDKAIENQDRVEQLLREIHEAEAGAAVTGEAPVPSGEETNEVATTPVSSSDGTNRAGKAPVLPDHDADRHNED